MENTQHVAESQTQTREESGCDIIGERQRVKDPSTGVEREHKDPDQEKDAREQGQP